MRLEPATGAEQPMNLYGAGGGYVLLACEQRQTTRTEMGLDGRVTTPRSTRNATAF